jgi:DnaJ family protein A protein 2
VKVQRLGPLIQQMQVPCNHCNGTGKIIDKKCLNKISKKITIPIKKGMCDGEKIILNGLGNFNIQTMENDNLIFIINEIEHEVFKREQNNLLLGLDITLLDSLIGFKFEFTHLDGEKIIIESNDIIKQDDIKVIKNKGMPYNSRNEVFGDLIFRFNIIYPNKIEKSDYDKFKNILSDSMFNGKIEESLNTYKLEKYNKSNDYEEDSGQQGPGCQQQ